MGQNLTLYRVAWLPLPETRLAQFGAAWTGWCPDRGQNVGPMLRTVTYRALAGATGTPGRAGLHAPLSCVFQLADGVSRYGLELALEEFAMSHAPVVVQPLVARLDMDRAVLAPSVPSARMTSLMAELRTMLKPMVVIHAADHPHTFALPLAGAIGEARSRAVVDGLAPSLKRIVCAQPSVGQIALMDQAEPCGPWRVVERYQLCAGAEFEGSPLPFSGPALLPPRLFAEALRCFTPEPEVVPA